MLGLKKKGKKRNERQKRGYVIDYSENANLTSLTMRVLKDVLMCFWDVALMFDFVLDIVQGSAYSLS